MYERFVFVLFFVLFFWGDGGSIFLKLPNVFTTATDFTIHEVIQFPCDLK